MDAQPLDPAKIAHRYHELCSRAMIALNTKPPHTENTEVGRLIEACSHLSQVFWEATGQALQSEELLDEWKELDELCGRARNDTLDELGLQGFRYHIASLALDVMFRVGELKGLRDVSHSE